MPQVIVKLQTQRQRKRIMYSKLLIWSTINTKSAIHSKWQILLVGLPPTRLTVKTVTLSQLVVFQSFLWREKWDCSMSPSLRKMSGISMEIDCCLPKPHLLLTCHNVASAFFRRLERVGWSHRGMALQGFGKGGAILLISQNKELG